MVVMEGVRILTGLSMVDLVAADLLIPVAVVVAVAIPVVVPVQPMGNLVHMVVVVVHISRIPLVFQ